MVKKASLDTMQLEAEDFVKLSTSWQAPYPASTSQDPDKLRAYVRKNDSPFDYTVEQLSELQTICWNKFHTNPQVNTSVRDMIGALTGHDFEMYSENSDVQDALSAICNDTRNALYHNLGKYVGRAEIEGELFLCLTLHQSGFVEIDFIDPATVRGWGSSSTGVLNHPKKKGFPLAYQIQDSESNEKEIIPSINLAYFPELYGTLQKNVDFDENFAKNSRKSGKIFSKLNGFYRFIVAWDRSLFTVRNVSHLRTTLEWIEYYEMLKRYEIDHKRSSGSYLWTVTFNDIKAFKLFSNLPKEQLEKTALLAPKQPGGTIIVPPGMEMKCVNPTLPKISEQDTDIMEMVTSGLNQPQDMITGTSKGTYGSVKASRGPQVDRTKNECAYFQRFLIYDFWRAVFFLRNVAMPSFKLEYKVRKAVSFNKKQPVFKNVMVSAHELVEVTFPVSEVADMEAVARALLGVKHGSIVETMGSPRKLVHRKLGLGNYHKARLEYADEEDNYPEVMTTADAESTQETALEPPVKGSDSEDESKVDPKAKTQEKPVSGQKKATPEKPALKKRSK